MWNIRVTVVSIVVGALGTGSKNLEKRLRELEVREKNETIQTIALLKSAWIHNRVLERLRYFLSLRIQWKLTIRSL